jgi:hypothetical protein
MAIGIRRYKNGRPPNGRTKVQGHKEWVASTVGTYSTGAGCGCGDGGGGAVDVRLWANSSWSRMLFAIDGALFSIKVR